MMARFIENSSLLNILVTIEFDQSNYFNHIFTVLLIVIISCANHGVMREYHVIYYFPNFRPKY